MALTELIKEIEQQIIEKEEVKVRQGEVAGCDEGEDTIRASTGIS